MAKERGLGRGFDSLIPTEIIEAEFDPTAKDTGLGRVAAESIRQLDPGSIDPNPHQPRLEFKAEALAGLAESIRHHGILQPLVVTEAAGGRYQLIAGERRLRAAKQLKLDTVPTIVRSFNEQQKLELALIENLQREDLNPIEMATAYKKLQDQFNLEIAEIGRRIGRDRSTVSNVIRLLGLPLDAKRAVVEGKISEGHGRVILSVPADKQAQLLAEMIKNNWTVRQAEEFARGAFKQGETVDKTKGLARTKPTNQFTVALSDYLKTKVSVYHTAKGGKLQIDFKDEDHLQRLTDLIQGQDS